MYWPHPIKAIIFDCDGLLLDSEHLFAQSIKDMTGFDLTNEIHLKIMGTNGPQCGKILMDAYGLEGDPAQFIHDVEAHLNKLLPQSTMMPGAEKLIRLFDSMKIPMSLASGSSRCNYAAKISQHKEVMELIKTTTFGNEVKKGKPDPEIFLVSMQKMGIDKPEHCLVFEDSPGGIKAADVAGFPSVMVPCNDFPYQELLEKFDVKPTLMLKSLEDFDLSMFDFSLFKQ